MTPFFCLNTLEDPNAEKVTLKFKVSISESGAVRDVALLDFTSNELENAVKKALFLWQFMPRIDIGDGPVASNVVLPIALRLNRSLLPIELAEND